MITTKLTSVNSVNTNWDDYHKTNCKLTELITTKLTSVNTNWVDYHKTNFCKY